MDNSDMVHINEMDAHDVNVFLMLEARSLRGLFIEIVLCCRRTPLSKKLPMLLLLFQEQYSCCRILLLLIVMFIVPPVDDEAMKRQYLDCTFVSAEMQSKRRL